jgi:aminoglycoside phosphotransferase (APT) family kinase protein
MNAISGTDTSKGPPTASLTDDALAEGLATVLSDSQRVDGTVRILERAPHENMSSYPSEVVKCELADASQVQLFCKYSAAVKNHLEFGHRGGIEREAAVYRHVLSGGSSSVPRFYGTFDDEASGTTCLVIENLNGALKFSSESQGQMRAAEWVGNFHRLHSPDMLAAPDFLPLYDGAYYRGWIDRTIEFASPLDEKYAWLADLEKDATEICDVLASAPVSVVHGEYYSSNVLVRDGTVYPVDWESAAVGPGEIDLASLTQGWPETDCRNSEHAYCLARWPAGAPPEFARRLLAARIYFLVRWLGEDRRWTLRRGLQITAEELRLELAKWRTKS